jgi:hypothetical protein
MKTGFLVLLIFFLLAINQFHVNSQEETPVVITQVELVKVSDEEFSVTWVTNLPSDSSVKWGTDEMLGESKYLDEETHFHSMNIEGLDPFTKYFFSAGSGGRWSPIDSFETVSPSGEYLDYTIAVVGDSHIDTDGQNSGNGLMYSPSENLFRSCVDQLNLDETIDLVVFIGDMVNGAQEDYEVFDEIVSDLQHPWKFTFGNWEKQNENWQGIASAYLDVGETYFSFDVPGYHLIILDSAESGEVGGRINDTQFGWLESDLEMNRFKKTIIFLHHPLEDEGIFTLESISKSRLNNILERNGQVLSVFGGHNHKNTISEINYRYHVSIGSVVQYPIGYSKIKLHEDGFSLFFEKVYSELQTSEQSKIRIDMSGGSTQEHQKYLGDLNDRSGFLEYTEKRPLILESMDINPEIVFPGDNIMVKVDAHDPYHEEILIQYILNGIELQETGPDIVFQAPEIPGRYRLDVIASIGERNQTGKMEFEVVPADSKMDDPPEILKIQSSKKIVAPGEEISISVDAIDPDGETMSFKWSSESGTITGSGSTITWKAPEKPGRYLISVSVFAGGKKVSGDIEILVEMDGEIDEIEEEATPFPFIVIIFSFMSFGIIRFRRIWFS